MKKKILIIVSLVIFIILGSVFAFWRHITTKGIWIDGFKYILCEDLSGFEVVDYNGTNSTVVFPAELFSIKVTRMEWGILDGNPTIEKVIVPSDADYWYQINECQNLKEIVYEEGVEFIKIDVSFCDNLTNVSIPDTVRKISGEFGYGCKSLKDVYIPDGVEKIGGGALLYSGLDYQHINDKYYVVGDDILLFYHGNFDELIIPNGIKKINWIVFLDANVENKEDISSIYIGESVIDVGNMDIDENVTAYFGSEEVTGFIPRNVKGTIVAPAGSYMEQYCAENNLNFRVMTEEEEAIWREKTEAAASEIVYQE